MSYRCHITSSNTPSSMSSHICNTTYNIRHLIGNRSKVSWEDTIQSSSQDVKTLAALCSAAGAEGAACQQFLADATEAVMKRAAELEAAWEKSGAAAAQQGFDEMFKERKPQVSKEYYKML